MAEFTVREVEGMRQVRIDIRDETVRARRGRDVEHARQRSR